MMKKVMLVGVLGSAMLFADQKIVSLSELTDENVESFTKGKLQDMVVKCPAGMVLPLTLSLQGEFLESDGHSSVKILKTCLVKCLGETFLFSLDGKNWKEFSAFFTGNLSVEFHNTDNGPFVGVHCGLQQK